MVESLGFKLVCKVKLYLKVKGHQQCSAYVIASCLKNYRKCRGKGEIKGGDFEPSFTKLSQ